ncbi:putative, caspase-like domain protein [Tanacetum coccineum]
MDRCKGCKNYLTVPIEQPCSFCYKVNKPKKTNRIFPQLLQYIDDYAHRPSNNNYYNGSYGPPLQTQPSYGGYYAPPPVYGSGYYSPQPQPPVYSDGYYRPPPQAVSPPIAYHNGYNSNFYQQPPMVHEKKRAVLCGVTYRGHKKTLPASVNNVRSMHQLLLKLGFPNSSIRILTEEESDPNRSPTRRNMLMAMEWLMKGCRSGDSLVFYYAGHGSHVVDYNGDEKDGYDEAICPVDYSVAGKILDDEVNSILVAPLPHGAKLHSIMDTCFSGTLLDLPYLCRINRGGFYKWEDHHPSHVASYGGTSGGRAICISACDDHQNSADTSAFTGTSIGALTYSFIQAVQSAHKLTYGDLLDNMRQIVRDAQERQGVNAPFASSTSQEPQLSSSTRFEIYSEPIIL